MGAEAEKGTSAPLVWKKKKWRVKKKKNGLQIPNESKTICLMEDMDDLLDKQFAEFIKNRMRQLRFNYEELAFVTSIDAKRLKDLMNATQKTGIKEYELNALANALEVDKEDLSLINNVITQWKKRR